MADALLEHDSLTDSEIDVLLDPFISSSMADKDTILVPLIEYASRYEQDVH